MQNFRSKEFLHELFLLSFGSLIFLLIKIFFTKYLNENHFSTPISYLLVHSLLLIVSWCYHSTITFKKRFSKSIFLDYSISSLFLKLIDYISVVVLIEIISLSTTLSIFLTSSYLFILRYLIFKKKIFK